MSQNSTPLIHFLVALACEAKPVVSFFGLKRRMDMAEYVVYQKNEMSLIISGVGKTAMAAAVAYIYVMFGSKGPSIWLNIGVAGHKSHSLGEIFVADKITDEDSGKRWYPPLLYSIPCCSASVATVSRPKFEYSESCLYDMEASGFFETAIRFSTSEIVQCVKIVSDNPKSPAVEITPRRVSKLIDQNIDVITDLLNQLKPLAKTIQTGEPVLFQAFTEKWHFTVQQKIQLSQILTRWDNLASEKPPRLEELANLFHAKDVLLWLKQHVEKLPINLT